MRRRSVGIRTDILPLEPSSLPNKREIIDIIENVPISDPVRNTSREGELKKLDGGRTYDYMLKNLFPDLRKASYIKVYYGNK